MVQLLYGCPSPLNENSFVCGETLPIDTAQQYDRAFPGRLEPWMELSFRWLRLFSSSRSRLQEHCSFWSAVPIRACERYRTRLTMCCKMPSRFDEMLRSRPRTRQYA